MAQETWLVVAVGAGFLLLGVAVSPLGWVALLHRRSNADRERERLAEELGEQVRALRTRVERFESGGRGIRVEGPEAQSGSGPPAPHAGGAMARRMAARGAGSAFEGIGEGRLIAVPRLSAAPDRLAMQGALGQRYAAIWELADSGATPDAIARATGQPIGQIELILGLRRQMDGGRTNIPHGSHE